MAFMQLQIVKGDGWIIETTGGDVVAPDINAPDADNYRAMIGTGRKVSIGDVYGEVTDVHYVKGYFGRYSAPGYLDCTDWTFSRNKRSLESDLRSMYGDDDNA